MDAKELRIGNYIQSQPLSIPRLQINQDGVMTVTGYGISVIESDTNNSMGFKPILITEKWLLDFGFLKDHRKYNPSILDNISYLKNGLKLTPIGDNRFRQEFSAEWLSGVNIDYVHQLQNFYFAFTRTELILKS